MKKGFKRNAMLIMISHVFICGLLITNLSAETPQYGGTLKILGIGDPRSFDNADWSFQHAADTDTFMEHLLVGDLQKGPRGTNEFHFLTGEWIPTEVTRGELAQSWEVKKDPLRIIFHLRKGIYWIEKEGVMKSREFTADDVVFSMTRLKNARRATPQFLDFIDRWEATDRYTAVAFLKYWNVNWAYRIGWGYYDAIQAPEQSKTEQPGYWKNATGTGPMMITNVKRGHSVEYTKNDNYWDTTLINGKRYKIPFIDKLVRYRIMDRSTQLTALRTGKLDILVGVFGENYEKLMKDIPELKSYPNPPSFGFLLAFRMDTKPFDDIRVRRALNMAVNQREIIDKLYYGNARLHTWPYPKEFGSVYTPFEELPESIKELYGYDPEKAKKLLAEAGYPNGFTFTAQYVGADERTDEIAPLIVAYLKNVGVDLTLEPLSYNAYIGKFLRKKHSGGLFFIATYGNPFVGIRKNFLPRQTWNPFMMNDPYIENEYTKTVQNPDLPEEEAYKAMKKLSIYALDKAPAILLPMQNSYRVYWPWVKNAHGEWMVGVGRAAPLYTRMWIDRDLKKKMGF